MQVKSKTENKLILTQKPLVTVFALLVFLAAIVFIFLSAENVATFKCERPAGTQAYCKMTYTSYLGPKERFKISVAEIYSAVANYSPVDERVESAILVRTKRGVRYLTVFNKFDVQENVKEINEFLEDKSDKDIVLTKDNTLFNIIYLVIFLVIAISFAALIEFIQVIVDKDKNIISMKFTTLFGSKTREVEIPDVKDVDVEIKSLTTDSDAVKQYRILLRTTSGKFVPLTTHYAINWNNTKKSADAIIEFLGLGE